MTTREEFEALLNAKPDFDAFTKDARDAYDAACREAFLLLIASKTGEKRKKLEQTLKSADDGETTIASALYVENHDAWQAIKERAEPFAEAVVAEYNAKRDARTARLTELAETLTPVPGPDWTLAYSTSTADYSTQPSAGTYAQNAAELQAMTYRLHGLEVEIRRRNDDYVGNLGRRGSILYLDVYAKTSAADVELVKLKPGLSVRDSVKACWKLGSNPRVYWPWLPHGYEASVGIDYHGNDVAVDDKVQP